MKKAAAQILGRVRAVAFAPDGHRSLSDDKLLRVVRRRQRNGADAGTAFVR
jgi:hypothetical protein